mmetsp:Transcript_7322/g.11113  ORF Transcript_7322/g.11113 Transcript_7322/m.11113 type:complete len:338 (-) Transcript_7322:120-1133(-)
MASGQNPIGTSKSAKFQAANPLGPMADPFAGLDGDEQEYQKELADNVNKRMERAVEELKEKHEKGTNEMDDPDRAPTGEPYRILQHQSAMRERQRRTEEAQDRVQEAETLARVKREVQQHFQKANDNDDGDDSSDDDEYDYLLEEDDDNNNEDEELEAIRQKRIAEMRQAQQKRALNLALGHGDYRTIQQDDFLPECSGKSEWVAIHFFHKEFERCKILDHHLNLIAPQHITCKFLRIDAEKAPFFVGKLQVRTLPTLIVFQEGRAIDRLTGFEGLAKDPNEPDKWHTGRLQKWLASTGAIEYTVPTEELKEEMDRLGLTAKKSMWSGGLRKYDEDV